MTVKSRCNSCSRRRLLQALALGTASAPLGCGGGPAGPEPFGTVVAGNAADIPIGALQPIPGVPAYIGRDEQGFYAMTSTCTHEGCDMISSGALSDEGPRCDCHGARFDRTGRVVQGPAETSLTHFVVEIDAEGIVSVLGGSTVDMRARTLPS
jgi:Rieske Fe-S protein